MKWKKNKITDCLKQKWQFLTSAEMKQGYVHDVLGALVFAGMVALAVLYVGYQKNKNDFHSDFESKIVSLDIYNWSVACQNLQQIEAGDIPASTYDIDLYKENLSYINKNFSSSTMNGILAVTLFADVSDNYVKNRLNNFKFVTNTVKDYIERPAKKIMEAIETYDTVVNKQRGKCPHYKNYEIYYQNKLIE